MKISFSSRVLLAMAVVTVLLSGCAKEKETIPEPSALTCAPDVFQKIMGELRDETNRITFSEACESFNKAQSMQKWEFKPSPPDDF